MAEWCAFLKRGGKRAVMATEAEAAADCLDKCIRMGFFKRAAGYNGNQQICAGQPRRTEDRKVVGDLGFKAVLAQQFTEDGGALLRFMPQPAAPNDDRLAHAAAS